MLLPIVLNRTACINSCAAVPIIGLSLLSIISKLPSVNCLIKPNSLAAVLESNPFSSMLDISSEVISVTLPSNPASLICFFTVSVTPSAALVVAAVCISLN